MQRQAPKESLSRYSSIAQPPHYLKLLRCCTCFCGGFKVPFFSNLEAQDLILLGSKLKPQPALAPTFVEGSDHVQSGFIMKEGDRGTDMWIISEGSRFSTL
jgi:hypothetical protein